MEYCTKGLTVLDSILHVPGSNLGLATDRPDCKFSKSVRANIIRASSGDIAKTLLVGGIRNSRTIVAMRTRVCLPPRHPERQQDQPTVLFNSLG